MKVIVVLYSRVVRNSAMKNLFCSLALNLIALPLAGAEQLFITMHTAPIENYCTACIVSKERLRKSGLKFKVILEPKGPWPWFKLTDQQGSQKTIHGTLTEQDVENIKQGEFPRDK